MANRRFLLICLAVVWMLVVATLYVVILAPAYVVFDRYDVPDWAPPGGDLKVPGYSILPRLVFPVFSVAVALACACLMLAVRESSTWVHWLARGMVAFHGLDWGVEVTFSFLGVRAGPTVQEEIGAVRWAVIAVGGLAILAALLLAMIPRRLLKKRIWPLATLAAIPFATYAPLFLVFGGVEVPTTGGLSLGPGKVGFPEDASIAHWIAFWSMNQVYNLAWAMVVLVWWQAFEAARGARDLAVSAVALLPRRSWATTALGVLVVGKVLMSAAGCAGMLSWLGESRSTCEVVSDDGVGSLVLAAVLVAGLTVWVVTQRIDPPAESGRLAESLVPAGWVLIIALSLWSFLSNLSIRVDQVLNKLLSPLDIDAPGTSPLFNGTRGYWAIVLIIFLGGVLAALTRRRWPGFALLLGLFALWNAVRAVAVAVGLWQYPWAQWTFEMFHDDLAGGPGWVDFFTLDVLITAAVATGLLSGTRAWRERWSRHLLLLLVATTVFAYSSELDLAGALRQGAGVVVAGAALAVGLVIVFPIIYTLLFDAEWINQPARRSARVSGATALCLLVLGVLVVEPSRATAGVYSGLAGQMLAVPVLLAVLLAGLADRRSPDPETAEDSVELLPIGVAAGEQEAGHDHRARIVDGDEGAHRAGGVVTAAEVPGEPTQADPDEGPPRSVGAADLEEEAGPAPVRPDGR